MRVALCSFIYDSFEEEETNRFRVIISDILRQHASCDSVIMACKPEKPRLLFTIAAEVFEHRDWSAFDTYGVAWME